ncbi:regulatory protein RecX [Caldicellulosiruptor acetigenus]|uniref:regulatory protein RecX n=1 Tax=Caldicellulosiruptor acetigenus TaxID=301953 RepID=UPI00040A45CC|nr:RecX family transcriptional regulator [Caldicellulosiruptor acetigenus]WAM35410.1 RecX family transcriptional regulator [Caldicellulosiruptor acetigenus]
MRILDKKIVGSRALLVFDDGKEVEIDREVYLEKGLYAKDEIDQKELEEVLFESGLKNAKKMLVSYIQRYPLKSEYGYYKYLLSRGYDSATALKAVAYFVNSGYIDEMEAAKKLVNKYQKKKSSFEILQLLRKNGFKSSTISKLNLKHENDKEILVKLLQKKLRRVNKKDSKEILKIIKWFVSRGYDYNTVVEKIREFLDY